MVVSLVAPPSGGDAHLSLNQRHLGDTIQGLNQQKVVTNLIVS